MEHRLEIDGWKTGIKFSACHMLLRHDMCSRLHGHSYSIHLKVHGNMNDDHMVVDFGKIKKILRRYAEELDHMTLIPTGNMDIVLKKDPSEDIVDVDMNCKKYRFPLGDVIFLPIPTTTVEEMSKYLLGRLVKEFDFPDNITKVELGMDEGAGQGAWASMDMVN
jgi:6-pyruvoyltetrahydropterin/6-carboxytetrahydropterin synthase